VEGELLLTGVEGAGRFLSLILKVQQAAGLVVMTKPKSHTQDHTSSKLRERRGDTALEHSPSHKQPTVHTHTHIHIHMPMHTSFFPSRPPSIIPPTYNHTHASTEPSEHRRTISTHLGRGVCTDYLSLSLSLSLAQSYTNTHTHCR